MQENTRKLFWEKAENQLSEYGIWYVLAIVLLVRLWFVFDWREVWWDSGVYVGMAKWLWSLGTSGLWEDFRPVLWPFVLGFFWKIGISPVIAARVLMFVLSLGCVWLVFKIGSSVFDVRTGLLTSVLFGFSQIFFLLGFHEYTEIPALFLVLFGFWLFLKEKMFLSGLFIGLAVLMRFPSGLFGITLLAVLCWERIWKKIVLLGCGFSAVFAPFMVFNYWLYGSPFHSLIAGQQVISKVLGCTVLHALPWYAYFQLLLFENVVNVFAVVGIALACFSSIQNKRGKILVVLSSLIPLLYYSFLPCRDYRYLLSFLPFVVLLAVFGFSWFVRKKWLWYALSVLLIIFAVFNAITFYKGEYIAYDVVAEQYNTFFHNVSASGEVWISNPVMAAYTDVPLHKVYYPVYDSAVALSFNKYLQQNIDRVEYVALDNCGGGIICASDDVQCSAELSQTLSFLSENYAPVLNTTKGRCWYLVFTNQNDFISING